MTQQYSRQEVEAALERLRAAMRQSEGLRRRWCAVEFDDAELIERHIEAQAAEIARLRDEKNAAYEERNQVVLALSRFYPHGWKVDPAEPEWPVLYLDLPTGQASWHFTKAEADASGIVATYAEEWDGHTTEEKYRRLAAVNPAYFSLAALGGPDA